MLYDILPPLLLLASFGGIVAIISRIVMRAQKDRLSQELQAHASTSTAPATEDLLRAQSGKIRVVGSRLASIPAAMKSMASGAKTITNRQREKTIQVTQQVRQRANGAEGNRFKRFGTGALAGVRGVKERAVNMHRQRQAESEITTQDNTSSVQPPQKFRLTRRTSSEEQTPQQKNTQSGTNKVGDHENVATPITATVRRIVQPGKKATPKKGPLQEAADCLRQSRYEQAEDILVPYIVQHTRDAKAYMLLGRAALGRGDWEEALEVFQQVKEIDDDAPGLYSALGAAAQEAGRMTLAVESLQRARDLEPTNIDIRRRLLKIAQRTDNRVLRQSVQEELRELSQPKQGEATAKAEQT